MNRIEWNPFRPNVFATFLNEFRSVFFFNSCPVEQMQFHFCKIDSGICISSVQWISETRVALGLERGGIEIWEIDESTTSAKIVKRFQHVDGEVWQIRDMAWDERTKCLAACSYGRCWIRIWSMDSDQPIHNIEVDGFCYSLAWRPNVTQTDDEGVDAARKSADNFILVCGLNNRKIVVLTVLEKEKTRTLISQQSNSFVMALSFSPDGRFLATTSGFGELIIWATENWEPVYIDVEEKIRVGRFSWLSSFTDVPDYKLTFDSSYGEIHVIEYAVGQNEKPSKDCQIEGSIRMRNGEGIEEFAVNG
ncbi:uncharacterized protein LOC124313240 [Daphnia pulicaria]|uniref:uncharacterized protein LOC124313240 n=1 Tax=Daphnia pulicaria TaxID=35523 RepID=UPI001EECE5BA|nr:uncharacterized protein LOC124313240 [Daphnia pulicaria]